MTQEEEDRERFNRIIDEANEKLGVESSNLMDVHHESIMYYREVIAKLREFMARYEEIVTNIIVAHSIAAKETADLYGDVIAGELGIVEVPQDEDTEDES